MNSQVLLFDNHSHLQTFSDLQFPSIHSSPLHLQGISPLMNTSLYPLPISQKKKNQVSFKSCPRDKKENAQDFFEYLSTFKSPPKTASYKEIFIQNHQPNLNFLDLKRGCPWLNEVSSDLLQNFKVSQKPLFQDSGSKLFKKKVFKYPSESKQIQYTNESMQSIQTEMMKYVDVEMILKNKVMSESICDCINKKFVLFLKGNYKTLKLFHLIDSSHLCSDVSQTIHDLTFRQQNSKLPTQTSDPRFSFASSTSISEGIFSSSGKSSINNFKIKEEGEEKASKEYQNINSKKNNRKQIFHNLSKYVMHFIIEILSDHHLEEFQIIPGYDDIIKAVIQNLRQSGKRNKLSQTYYFNHSHYNCLFLLITEENKQKLQSQQEFIKLQNEVFGEINYSDNRQLLNLNIIKKAIGQIVQQQIDHILDQINEKYNFYLFELGNLKSDCQAKIHYLKSVKEGVTNLLQGNYMIRF